MQLRNVVFVFVIILDSPREKKRERAEKERKKGLSSPDFSLLFFFEIGGNLASRLANDRGRLPVWGLCHVLRGPFSRAKIRSLQVRVRQACTEYLWKIGVCARVCFLTAIYARLPNRLNKSSGARINLYAKHKFRTDERSFREFYFLFTAGCWPSLRQFFSFFGLDNSLMIPYAIIETFKVLCAVIFNPRAILLFANYR